MPNGDDVSDPSASRQVFEQIEQNLEAGGGRDMWQNIRTELDENGTEGVRSYLDSEYQRRKAIVQSTMENLASRLEETT